MDFESKKENKSEQSKESKECVSKSKVSKSSQSKEPTTALSNVPQSKEPVSNMKTATSQSSKVNDKGETEDVMLKGKRQSRNSSPPAPSNNTTNINIRSKTVGASTRCSHGNKSGNVTSIIEINTADFEIPPRKSAADAASVELLKAKKETPDASGEEEDGFEKVPKAKARNSLPPAPSNNTTNINIRSKTVGASTRQSHGNTSGDVTTIIRINTADFEIPPRKSAAATASVEPLKAKKETPDASGEEEDGFEKVPKAKAPTPPKKRQAVRRE